MFEVRCLVADKRLADVLRALRKLTLEPPVTIAVDEPQANGATPPVNRGGNNNVTELVTTYIDGLQKKGIKQIVARDLRELCLANGLSPHSYSYPIAKMVKGKVLKMTKAMGVYEVLK